MKITRGIALAAAAAMSLATLAACGSDTAQDEETPDSLSFWYYEEDDAGQTQAWRRAAEAFEKETGVEIKFERKSFTQIAQNGSQFLNSDEAPDLMESNRGNGSAGVLSTMGLLTDLGDYVSQYGWDKKVTGANAAVAKYDENGIMDGDTWYGMTSYAEFQRVYYNKDLFAKYGLEIPTTYDEFVEVCQKFVDAGVTPIAAVAAATIAAAEAAATTAVTTAAVRAAEAARTLFAGASLVDDDGTAADRLAVQAVDGCLGFGIRAHLDEAEALRAAGFAVHHDLGGLDRAELGESSVQFFVANAVGQVAHVEFVAHGRAPFKQNRVR